MYFNKIIFILSFIVISAVGRASDLPQTEADYRQKFCQNRELDFAKDVTSWTLLDQAAQDLTNDMFSGKTPDVSNLKSNLQNTLRALNPDSGFYTYLQGLHQLWFKESYPPPPYPWRPQPPANDYFDTSAKRGYPLAKRQYYDRLLEKLKTNDWPEEKEKAENILLEATDSEAAFYLNKGIVERKFVDIPRDYYQNKRQADAQFAKLKQRAEGGDIEALRWMHKANLSNDLFQYDVPEQERQQALLEDEKKTADPYLSHLVDRAIYDGDFGYNQLSKETQLEQLLVRESLNRQTLPCLSPHHFVNLTLRFQWDVWSQQPGFKGHDQELEKREAGGDWDASNCISKLIYNGKLGTKYQHMSAEKRYMLLFKRAKQGNDYARTLLCIAHGKGEVGQPQDEKFAQALRRSFDLLELLEGVPDDLFFRYGAPYYDDSYYW